MKKILSRALLASIVLGASSAYAITFTAVSPSGTLSLIGTLGTDWQVNTTSTDLDLLFNKLAIAPGLNGGLATASATFTFEATTDASDKGALISGVDLIANVFALGTGGVQITEIVEDLTNGGTPITKTVNAPPPGSLFATITLPKPTNHVKIKKTVDLFFTPNSDRPPLAGVGLMEQRFHTSVPEPTSVAVMGVGLVAVIARRRKRA